MWFMGYPLDWDESLLEGEQIDTQCQHRYKEVVNFNMTHWECETCGTQIKFDEIQEHQTITSRCSMFKLPYE